MAKVKMGPQTVLVPLPVTLLSAQLPDGKPNIITISWVGICCSIPPMLGVGIRENRFSYDLVKKSGEFVLNIPNEDLVHAADYCGNVSGRDHNKFKEMKLTAIPGDIVSAPLIKECPINMECQVRHVLKLGSHDYFVAEIVETHIDANCLDDKNKLNVDALRPYAYMTQKRTYYGGFTKIFGDYGYSIKKK